MKKTKKSFGLASITNKLNIPPASHSHWQQARVWDRWQEEYRPRVGSFYQAQRVKVANYVAHLDGPLSVLELCCGTGRLAFDLLSSDNVARLTVIDISPQAMATLHRRLAEHPRVSRLQAGTANVLTFVTWPPAATFDVVICIDALPNLSWSALSDFFQQITRLLTPGGHFVGNYLSSESIDAHTTRKHGRLGYWRIYSRLLLGQILGRVRPSLAGQKGLLRTGTAYRTDLQALLEPAFTIEQFETDVYHWFTAVPKE